LTESEKSEDGDAVLFKGVVPGHIYPLKSQIQTTNKTTGQNNGVRSTQLTDFERKCGAEDWKPVARILQYPGACCGDKNFSASL